MVPGALEFIVITTLKVAVPPEFDAVTVYVAVVTGFVGVPENIPVAVSSTSPAGSDGDTL